ncbi:glycosyltransferase [Alteromonas facilis]|uniref:glycosyltransferase n=1 Tax=Alteromonas facilis TaxID=2048004 RepID=UPI000C288E7B|nr:glycosyltransferase [Alteromonas facilis]
MKILHIASGDLWAGAEVQMSTLLKELVKEHQVYAILLNHGRLESDLKSAGVEVAVLDESTLSFFTILNGVRGLITRIKPDVVHTHRQKENILGGIANALSAKAACVRTVHGSSEFSLNWKQKIQRGIDHFVGRFLQQGIISVSDTLTEELCHSFSKGKIHTLMNGIDVASVIKDSQLTVTPIASGKIHVCLAGRMVSVKRVDLFLEMAKCLLELGSVEPAFAFHVFGDGPLLEQHKRLAKSLGILESVTFHGHCDDIRARLSQMDVVVMTSDHEGLPMTALEALALNKPLVAHAVGGLIPLLQKAWPEGLVSEHTTRGYTEAVLSTIRSIRDTKPPELPQEFTAHQNARSVCEVYESLVTNLAE